MIRAAMSDAKRGRGRPRRAGADEAILTTALEMLRAIGFQELTVDAIAERTGIAKTTIYRRWPSKGALVAAAIAPLAEPRADEDILAGTAALLEVLGEPDGEIVEVLRALLTPRIKALGESEEAYRTIGAMLAKYLL
ncbi:MAG TPA: helix-turn-helix domain-containing protein [Thermoanaerobaculia bacterium]|nr:helix-turn-helix domain-containing protein [Thermoanaerobaculia bacterium]